VRAHRQRLAEMVAAAMNAAEVETLAEDLGERGMSEITTDKEVSGTDGALIGRSVEATKD